MAAATCSGETRPLRSPCTQNVRPPTSGSRLSRFSYIPPTKTLSVRRLPPPSPSTSELRSWFLLTKLMGLGGKSPLNTCIRGEEPYGSAGSSGSCSGGAGTSGKTTGGGGGGAGTGRGGGGGGGGAGGGGGGGGGGAR